MSTDSSTRLDSFLAQHGVTSRRNVQTFLLQNTVTLNGKRIRRHGLRFTSEDKVLVNGKPVKMPEYIYIIVHKPRGIISTATDEYGRKNVLSLFQTSKRLYPVGRLDKNSTGIMLLTNDGELANHLTHPRYHIPKTYEVLIEGKISGGKLEKLRTGVTLDEGITAPAQVKIKQQLPTKTLLEMTIYEGRNRQIRRMLSVLHIQIRMLKRIAIGPLKLGNLQEGANRSLTNEEITTLKRITNHQ